MSIFCNFKFNIWEVCVVVNKLSCIQLHWVCISIFTSSRCLTCKLNIILCIQLVRNISDFITIYWMWFSIISRSIFVTFNSYCYFIRNWSNTQFTFILSNWIVTFFKVFTFSNNDCIFDFTITYISNWSSCLNFCYFTINEVSFNFNIWSS